MLRGKLEYVCKEATENIFGKGKVLDIHLLTFFFNHLPYNLLLRK